MVVVKSFQLLLDIGLFRYQTQFVNHSCIQKWTRKEASPSSYSIIHVPPKLAHLTNQPTPQPCRLASETHTTTPAMRPQTPAIENLRTNVVIRATSQCRSQTSRNPDLPLAFSFASPAGNHGISEYRFPLSLFYSLFPIPCQHPIASAPMITDEPLFLCMHATIKHT